MTEEKTINLNIKNEVSEPKEEVSQEPETGNNDTIQYLVSRVNDFDFIIDLPKSYKLTFAAVNPAKAQSYGEGFCLRVYEGQKLRAVFDNVKSFRDLSIPLARKIETQTGSANWTRDDSGNLEESRKVKTDTKLMIEESELPF